jgi:hypothetical protein
MYLIPSVKQGIQNQDYLQFWTNANSRWKWGSLYEVHVSWKTQIFNSILIFNKLLKNDKVSKSRLSAPFTNCITKSIHIEYIIYMCIYESSFLGVPTHNWYSLEAYEPLNSKMPTMPFCGLWMTMYKTIWQRETILHPRFLG